MRHLPPRPLLRALLLLGLACAPTTARTGGQVVPKGFMEDGPLVRSPAPKRTTLLAFDTDSHPEAECKYWNEGLELARQMAGCDEAFRCRDPEQKCQKRVRQCSPGCDICKNLKPGGGADTEFGLVLQPRGRVVDATTISGFFYGYDSKFDVRTACATSAFQLARVMVHEAIHACPMAGGAKPSFDSNDTLKRCEDTSCCTDAIAPVNYKSTKTCGDRDGE